MPETQSFKNHSRRDPIFHFVLVPIFLLNIIFAIYTTIHRWPHHSRMNPWWIVMSIALLMLLGLTRTYTLKVQDHVIRLEERMRIAALVPAASVSALSTRQLIALRFVSDAELPTLVYRTVAENLEPKAIKESIVNWRADNERI
jgi:hypothetical protein